MCLRLSGFVLDVPEMAIEPTRDKHDVGDSISVAAPMVQNITLCIMVDSISQRLF